MKTRLLVGLLIIAMLISGCAKEKTEVPSTGETIPEGSAQTKTASDCEKITAEKQRDDCYKEIAAASNDLSLCDKIENKFSKASCYAGIGTALNDLYICDRIQDDQLYKDNCYDDMAASTGESSLCEQISRESMKNSCLLTLAMDTKNIALCDKVTVDNVRFTNGEDCSSVVTAVSAADYARCEQISSSILRSECCEKVAMDTKDVALCDDAMYKDDCYRFMAVSTGESSLCERIDLEFKKNSCYNQVAVHTRNSNLCYKITDPRTKGNCIDLFREYFD